MPAALVTDSRFALHTLQGHPEHAGRLTAIQHCLDHEGLTGRLLQLEAKPATDEDLLAVHTADYLAQLDSRAGVSLSMLGLDTYVVSQSYQIARLAAGGVLRAVDAVMKHDADHALAAIRPPGHHATASTGMGFCLLNNLAIAVRYAQRVYGIERVLIVDYDVHHGNGTHDIFYEDPTVFYISTHQSPLYPGTGMVRETGQGAGAGYTLNIPMPAGVGDQGYSRVFEQIVWPAAQRFQPELILVSVGFDAHWSDPLANMQLSLDGYDHLARVLLDAANTWCGGRIVFVLEGGYNLEALGYGCANVARALLGDSAPTDPLGPAHGKEPPIVQLIEGIRQLHKLD